MNKDIVYLLLLLLGLGFILHIMNSSYVEGFSNSSAPRCGINMPCPNGLKCINGFCAKTERLPLADKNPIELLPPGSPAPYF
jgi:hypothetical protein